mgnify:FL=1
MKEKKVVAIVQARMGSSRFSGKVLKPLGNSTVLESLINRLKNSSTIDQIVIATSLEKRDAEIIELFKDSNIKVFKGSENDVLDRYIETAIQTDADIIVRVTGDCPLIDPKLVDDCVNKIIDSDLDYVSNCNNIEKPLPDGFDVEVFTMNSLRLIQKISITSAYKEHVTFGYFKTNLFAYDSIEYDQNYGHFRLTLDYEEDYTVISKVYEEMKDSFWGWKEICKFLQDNKDIVKINAHIKRNASWDKSIEADGLQNRKNYIEREKVIAHSSGLLSKRYDQFSPGLWPKNYLKAKGQTIWTDTSKLFLDYSIGGIGATTLGFANDFIDNRVIKAIKDGSASSLNSALEVEATNQLIDLIPWVESARYTRSGGEATTLAIRLARAKTQKAKVLFSGYHGWHDWYLAAAFKNKLGNHLLDDLPILGVPKELEDTSFPFDYGDFDGFSRYIEKYKGEVAAVILEPMRYALPDKDFLLHVRNTCNKHNIVMIFDEISSGFRFNNSATHLDVNVIPDIVVFSKAIGNGYPIACIAGNMNVMNSAKDSFISSTTHTESIGFASMSAVLEFYKNNDVARMLGERGAAIKSILTKISNQYDIKIKISGLDQLWSWSFDYDDDYNRKLQTVMTEQMLMNSILFSNRFYPTLGIDPNFYGIFEKKLENAFQRVKIIIDNNDDPINHINYGINKLGIYS